MAHEPDPVLKNSRREAIVIGLTWLASTVYCCVFTYAFGYRREGRVLGVADIRPVLGVPAWFFWGVLVPWAACAVFTFWFAGYYMKDDDLGKDHTKELEGDIREGGLHE